jgi:ketosteroid isomerase-like protein
MTGDQFARLLNDFTLSAESGDGARFAGHFTEDAIYYDYIYGAHKGRAEIAHMMQNLFHRDAADYRWEMFDPVFDGEKGYAWSLSSFTSKIPQFEGKRVVIDGMSRFMVRDGLIAEYRESVNGGVAMAQLGVEPDLGVQALDRMAQGASGNSELSGAPKRYTRREARLKAHINNDVLSPIITSTGRSR